MVLIRQFPLYFGYRPNCFHCRPLHQNFIHSCKNCHPHAMKIAFLLILCFYPAITRICMSIQLVLIKATCYQPVIRLTKQLSSWSWSARPAQWPRAQQIYNTKFTVQLVLHSVSAFSPSSNQSYWFFLLPKLRY